LLDSTTHSGKQGSRDGADGDAVFVVVRCSKGAAAQDHFAEMHLKIGIHCCLNNGLEVLLRHHTIEAN